jgi:hypothetical protein
MTRTYHSELIKRPGSLNVLESLLEVGQFSLDATLGSLGALDGLSLESLDGLELTVDIVRGGLEGLEVVLDLVDDGLVLQDLAVGGEVDGLRLLGENLDLTAGIVISLLEGLQGRSRLTAKAQRAGHLGPVDLNSGATL